jgi:hypothetical protein
MDSLSTGHLIANNAAENLTSGGHLIAGGSDQMHG